MKSVDAKLYTKKYFLENCGGYLEYQKYKGTNLSPRHLEIIKDLKLLKNKTILDIGCGRGELALWLVKNGAKKVVGIDYSKSAIILSNYLKKQQDPKIKNRLDYFVMNAKDINQLKDSFDIVIMTEVYEHLYPEELDIVFNNVKTILKKDGIFYIHTSPNKWFYDYFYRYWSYWVSTLLIAVSDIVSGRKYPRLLKYEDLRDGYQKKMHVNEPTYFSLKNMIIKHGFKGNIRTSNITTIKPKIGYKDEIFNFLVFLYPISNYYPFNILMGCDFHVLLKINEI